MRVRWTVASEVGIAAGMMGALASLSGFGADAPPTQETQKTWSSTMRSLQGSLQELLVDLNSESRFNDPENEKRIRKNAKAILKNAHQIGGAQSGKSPDRDPSIPIFASLFARESELAVKSLEWGQRSYARSALRSLTGYCVACHTRNNVGPQFSVQPGDPAIQGLSPVEVGEYFTAVREYEAALAQFEKIASDREFSAKRPFEWERAVRAGLALSVRVKKDPERALKIVESVLQTPQSPYFLKEQASRWKADLQAWKKEPVRRSERTPTEAERFAEANRLMQAASRSQHYPADRGADVLFLRANAAVHELLGAAPEGKHSTEALYLAGLSYEVLQDHGLGELNELYFLTCIERAPHTPIARKCFRHYESSVYAGYTGSGGTHLPEEVMNRLNELDRLSTPQSKESLKPLNRP